jgi:hypothetical protein
MAAIEAELEAIDAELAEELIIASQPESASEATAREVKERRRKFVEKSSI